MERQYQTNENRRARAKRSGLGSATAVANSSDQGSNNAPSLQSYRRVQATSNIALWMTGAAAIVALTAHDLRHLAATVPAGDDGRHQGYATLAEQSAGFLAWLSEQLAALELESTEARP